MTKTHFNYKLHYIKFTCLNSQLFFCAFYNEIAVGFSCLIFLTSNYHNFKQFCADKQ